MLTTGGRRCQAVPKSNVTAFRGSGPGLVRDKKKIVIRTIDYDKFRGESTDWQEVGDGCQYEFKV